MSRFVSISESEIEELLEKDAANTKNVVNQSILVFAAFCVEKGICFDGITNEALSAVLQKFYAGARTVKGELYSSKSLMSFCYGLRKNFERTMNVDIVKSEEFKCSNKVFQAMFVKLKKEGKSVVQHKSPLSKDDLDKLYSSFDLQDPEGLQNKVFVDFMLYFCNRGRDNLRELRKEHLIVHEEEGYIDLRDMPTKNHRGTSKDADSERQGGRIYKTRDDGHLSCPFTSFVKYLSVLNPDCESFFQRAKKTASNVSDVCFDNVTLGKTTIDDKMKVLSAKAKFSKIYTNHCLRATSIILLNGYEARHVMAVSGHKSETSIRTYGRTDDQQRQKMALTIAEATGTARSAKHTQLPVSLAVTGTTYSAVPTPPAVSLPDSATTSSAAAAPHICCPDVDQNMATAEAGARFTKLLTTRMFVRIFLRTS